MWGRVIKTTRELSAPGAHTNFAHQSIRKVSVADEQASRVARISAKTKYDVEDLRASARRKTQFSISVRGILYGVLIDR